MNLASWPSLAAPVRVTCNLLERNIYFRVVYSVPISNSQFIITALCMAEESLVASLGADCLFTEVWRNLTTKTRRRRWQQRRKATANREGGDWRARGVVGFILLSRLVGKQQHSHPTRVTELHEEVSTLRRIKFNYFSY